jgi:hypothetical protein
MLDTLYNRAIKTHRDFVFCRKLDTYKRLVILTQNKCGRAEQSAAFCAKICRFHSLNPLALALCVLFHCSAAAMSTPTCEPDKIFSPICMYTFIWVCIKEEHGRFFGTHTFSKEIVCVRASERALYHNTHRFGKELARVLLHTPK